MLSFFGAYLGLPLTFLGAISLEYMLWLFSISFFGASSSPDWFCPLKNYKGHSLDSLSGEHCDVSAVSLIEAYYY